MLKVEHEKWNQNVAELLDHAIHEEHPRVRERYFALYLIANGTSANRLAGDFGHDRDTLSDWCHLYNQQGPDALKPVWPGKEPELTPDEFAVLEQALDQHPREVGFKQGKWTGKLVAAFVKREFHKDVVQETGIHYLHRLNKSLQRPRKRFRKADPQAQREFAQELEETERCRARHSVTAYLDEAQIWLDVRPSLTWSTIGEPAEVDSFSPGKKKILFFGCVLRPLGKVITQLVPVFNGDTTITFLHKLRDRLKGYRIDLVWDGASYHKRADVRDTLAQLNIHDHPLPGYSPKMNADEYFNRWTKEVLSDNTAWQDVNQLKRAFTGFVASLAKRPQEVLQRCKPDMLGFHVQ